MTPRQQPGVPCLEIGCNDYAVRESRCRKHYVPWSGSTRAKRLPSNWASLRRIVFQRDKSICHICKGPGADAIDHLIAGDNHNLSNLAPIHQNVAPYCHRSKSSSEGNLAKGSKVGKIV